MPKHVLYADFVTSRSYSGWTVRSDAKMISFYESHKHPLSAICSHVFFFFILCITVGHLFLRISNINRLPKTYLNQPFIQLLYSMLQQPSRNIFYHFNKPLLPMALVTEYPCPWEPCKGTWRGLPYRELWGKDKKDILTFWRLTTHIWVVPHR